eukprot:jgi/Orpsp1_1/1178761/evm.model.c7180000066639.1
MKLFRLAKGKGANMYQIDKEGRNLFMYSLEVKANIKTVKYLYSLNYNLGQKDVNGNTIYTYATMSHTPTIYNKVLPFLLKNFIYNNNIIITLIIMGKNRRGATNGEIQKIIKNNNELINIKNNKGDTAFLIAIKTYRQVKILSYLKELGSRMDEVDNNGSSPLIVAAQYRNLKALKFVLQSHPDLNFKNNYNDTALIAAAKSNNTSMIKILLKYRERNNEKKNKDDNSSNLNDNPLNTLKVNEQNNDGETAFSTAVRKNNREMIECLADAGVDVELCNNNKETPLIIAVKSGNETTVNIILNIQKNINGIDINHETALIIAIKNKLYSIAERLLKKGVDITIRDKDFRTPLMIAASQDDHNVSSLIRLIARKHNNTMEARDKDGKSALLLAISNKCTENASILLELGADPLNTDNNKNNAFILACKYGIYSIVQNLITNYDCVDINSRNKNLNTGLMKACKVGNDSIIRFLLQKRANFELTNHNGNTALIIACIHSHLSAARSLLESGADIEKSNKEGVTPVIAACRTNNYDLIKTIIFYYGAKINSDDPLIKQQMENCFIDNIEKGHYEIVKALLNQNVQIDTSNKNNTFYKLLSALITATENAQYKIVEEVLSQHQFKNILEEYRRTKVLIQAFRGMKRMTIEFLFKLDVDVNVADDQGNTALIEAAKIPQLYSFAKELINRKANINVTNEEGITPFLNSCTIPESKMFKHLIKKKANIFVTDNNGNNALMFACGFANIDKVRYLVKNGINVNASNNNGNTALMQAVSAGKTNITKYLIKYNANVNLLNHNGQNALSYAVIKAYTDKSKNSIFKFQSIIKLLIDKGSDANVPVDPTGNTILMLLIMKNDFEMIKYLMEHTENLDINKKNHLGHNAFTYALKCNNETVINYIIQHGIDIFTEDDYGNDMIMYSTCTYNPTLFNKFIQSVDNVGINKCNHKKETYLIMATKMNNEKVIHDLLDRGADVNLQDIKGNTALHYASAKGNAYTIEMLINNKADIEIKNYQQETPIMVACRFKQTKSIKTLLDH